MRATRWVSAWLVLQLLATSGARADEPVPPPAGEHDAQSAEGAPLRLQIAAPSNDVVQRHAHTKWLSQKQTELEQHTYTRSILFLVSGSAVAVATGFVFVADPEAFAPGTVLGLLATATIATGVVLASRTAHKRREIRRIMDASEGRLQVTPVLSAQRAGVSVAVRF